MSDRPFPPMRFWRFWLETIKRSYSLGWLVFGVVSTGMPATITVLQHWYPKLAKITVFKTISEYQTEIQVAIAALFIVSYLFYAPYRIYREAMDTANDRLKLSDGKIATLQSEQEEKKRTFEQQISKLQARLDTRDKRQKLADKIAVVMEKGRQMLNGYKRGMSVFYPAPEKINDWTLKDVNPVLNELGMSYIARFNAAPETMDAISVVGVPSGMIEDYCWLAARVKILEDFIKEVTPL